MSLLQEHCGNKRKTQHPDMPNVNIVVTNLTASASNQNIWRRLIPVSANYADADDGDDNYGGYG